MKVYKSDCPREVWIGSMPVGQWFGFQNPNSIEMIYTVMARIGDNVKGFHIESGTIREFTLDTIVRHYELVTVILG